MARETIFAPATAAGRAGVAIVRISGPGAGAALSALRGKDLPPPRRAVRARLADPETGDALDDGLALWFPGPASFTGEDVAELHIHGGRATVEAVMTALAGMAGLRVAEAGEFTRRAFDNGRLDLTGVEGLADLVAAETEAQRRQALRQLDGALGALFEEWRGRLLRALALAEAELDFPEERLPDDLATEINHNIEYLIENISQYLDDDRRGERIREGVFIAILGAPNVGKSSLLNALARRDVAIVSDIAGTTRDVLEVHLDLGGFAVTVADTAGLRTAADAVEREGVRRALDRAGAADLRLVVVDASEPELDGEIGRLIDDDAIVVMNKTDLLPPGAPLPEIGPGLTVPLSVKTGANFDRLIGALTNRVGALVDRAGPAPLTRRRHRQALGDCLDALRRAAGGGAAELVAEDVRLAARALGRVTGRVDVEDVLDLIFREFCIGK
jgi:tRNA modification GTPase